MIQHQSRNNKNLRTSMMVFCLPKKEHATEILLPSAVHLEERLTVSQSVPEPRQQAVRQKHTVWVFCSGRCGPKQRGGPLPLTKQWPSGNVADRHPFGRRFEPRLGEFGAAAATAKSHQTRIRTTDRKLFVNGVPIGPPFVYKQCASPLLVAF